MDLYAWLLAFRIGAARQGGVVVDAFLRLG